MVKRNDVSFNGEKQKSLLWLLLPASWPWLVQMQMAWAGWRDMHVSEKLSIYLPDAKGEIARSSDSTHPSGKWVQLPRDHDCSAIPASPGNLCATAGGAEDLALREHKATLTLACSSREGRREVGERNNPRIQSNRVCPAPNWNRERSWENSSFKDTNLPSLRPLSSCCVRAECFWKSKLEPRLRLAPRLAPKLARLAALATPETL